MALIRQYLLTAKFLEEGALLTVLADLAGKVRAQHGCEDVKIYVEAGASEKFLFVESWTSRWDQENGGEALGKGAFAAIMPLLAEPPRSVDLEPVNR